MVTAARGAEKARRFSVRVFSAPSFFAASHHLTISPSHHLTISPSHHLTISPSHHLTISPSHHLTISPSHHLTISPSHHLTISPTIRSAICWEACPRPPRPAISIMAPSSRHAVRAVPAARMWSDGEKFAAMIVYAGNRHRATDDPPRVFNMPPRVSLNVSFV